MLEDSDWLLATVEQVLKAGELGQRTQNQPRLPVDMRTLALDCIDRTRARHHLDESAITFEDSGDRTPVVVRGNREELQSVVMNILDNAVKYSPKTLEIRVALSIRNEAWIILSVSDRGIGIPTSQLKRIFKRFYRVPMRTVLRTKGTGLGLFIVRTIARQHGGDAFAESAGEGGGTTVSVELPRLLRQPAKEPELSSQ
jgi:signal transduction histidine kinase